MLVKPNSAFELFRVEKKKKIKFRPTIHVTVNTPTFLFGLTTEDFYWFVVGTIL